MEKSNGGWEEKLGEWKEKPFFFGEKFNLVESDKLVIGPSFRVTSTSGERSFVGSEEPTRAVHRETSEAGRNNAVVHVTGDNEVHVLEIGA